MLTLLFTLFGCGGGDGGEGESRTNPCPECETGELSESVTTPATPYEDGVSRISCSVCGYEKTQPIEKTKSIKILLIGDMTTAESVSNLYEFLHGSGLNSSVVATASCAYTSGASIDMHLSNAKSDTATYNVSVTKGGKTTFDFGKSLSYAISLYDWDYISVGQSLVKAGIKDSYSNLGELLDYLEGQANADAKLLLHMPWALNDGSTVAGFEHYGKSSEAMQNAILSVVKEISDETDGIDGVVPLCAAIGNVRSSDFGEDLCGSTIGLTPIGKMITSYLWYSYLTGDSSDSFPEGEYDSCTLKIMKNSIKNAMESGFEIRKTQLKTIKILIFGNSYGNDAIKFMTQIFLNGGYDKIIIGSLSQGGCNINHHVTYLDDDPTNDFKGGFSYSKIINGERQTVTNSYDYAIKDEDWDIITLQHAPAEVEQIETYSQLDFLLNYILERVTNPDVKLIYHMIWKYHSDTAANYDKIVEITRDYVLKTGAFSGVISSLELICQMKEMGITYEQLHRDYAHLSMGLGRYALGLMWYCYLTGEAPESIDFRPSYEDVEMDLGNGASKLNFIPVEDDDFSIISAAIKNAISKPYGDSTEEGQGGAFDPDNFFAKGSK